MKTANRTRPDYNDTIRLEASHIVQRLYFEKPTDPYLLLYHLMGRHGIYRFEPMGRHGTYRFEPIVLMSFKDFMYFYRDLIKKEGYEERYIHEVDSIINNGYNKKWMDSVLLNVETITSARISVSEKTGATQMYIPFQNFQVV